MEYGQRVYSSKHKKIGKYISSSFQSGYPMCLVKFNDEEDYCYIENILELDKDLSNVDIWLLAENRQMPLGAIIEDQEGNQFIFTNRSFQLYSEPAEEKYYGLCVKDIWRIIDVREDEL